MPLHAAEYGIDCDLWDVLNSCRAGSLHVRVQPTGAFLPYRCLVYVSLSVMHQMPCCQPHAQTSMMASNPLLRDEATAMNSSSF